MKLTSSLTHDERDLCFEVAAMSVNRFLDLDYMEIDEVKLSHVVSGSLQLSKKRSVLPKLFLRPIIEWMVVTLRTLDTHPHEHLSHILGRF